MGGGEEWWIYSEIVDELVREVALMAIHFDEWGRGGRGDRSNYSITHGAFCL